MIIIGIHVVICVTRSFVHAKSVTVYLYMVVEISIVLFYFPSLPITVQNTYIYTSITNVFILFFIRLKYCVFAMIQTCLIGWSLVLHLQISF